MANDNFKSILAIGGIAVAGYLVYKLIKPAQDSFSGVATGISGIGSGVSSASQGIGSGISSASQGIGSALGEIAQGISSPFEMLDNFLTGNNSSNISSEKIYSQNADYNDALSLRNEKIAIMQEKDSLRKPRASLVAKAEKLGISVAEANKLPAMTEKEYADYVLKQSLAMGFSSDIGSNALTSQLPNGILTTTEDIIAAKKEKEAISKSKYVEPKTTATKVTATKVTATKATTTKPKTTKDYNVGDDVGGGWILTKKG